MPQPSGNSSIRVRALATNQAEMMIYGDIGEGWAGESVAAKEVVERLSALEGVSEIMVRINSYGGSVADGIAIYNALKAHPARKTVVIDSVAASIASLIAMAGDTVTMSRLSLMMIHAPWSGFKGNSEGLRRHADVLDRYAAAMAEAYAAKSGRPVPEMLALLKQGFDHWFTADEALAAGFIDSITEAAGFDSEADADAFAQGLTRFTSRAPARIAASLRDLAKGAKAMQQPNAKNEILAAERDRRNEIRSMAGDYAHSPDHKEFVNAALDDAEMSPEIFGKAMLKRMAAGREPLAGGGHVVAGGGRSGEDFIEAASDALVIRAGIPLSTPHAGSRDFMRTDVADLARACLNRAGRSSREFDRVGVIRAALSTSDFPALLGNALGKSLRQGYEAEPQSHTGWARFVQVEDFKQQVRALLSSAPDLMFVPEGGEYQEGAIDDDSAQYAVSKYGRIIRLTWEALVNDDLGAFVRIPQAMGQAARRKEADLVYSLFAANSGAGPTMQDGAALFHADHANLVSTPAALSDATLSTARTLLRKQTAKGGGLLNLQPRFLIVPAELETQAEALVATSARAVAQSSGNGVLPTWIGALQLVVEPRLDDGAFYLAAGSDQVDTLEVAGLAADGGKPVVEEENEFVRDAKAWKIRHVVAAAFTDWRGIVKVPVS